MIRMTDTDQQSADTGYRCDACGETFDSAAALEQHVLERGLVV